MTKGLGNSTTSSEARGPRDVGNDHIERSERLKDLGKPTTSSEARGQRSIGEPTTSSEARGPRDLGKRPSRAKREI